MSKQILFGENARTSILKGFKKTAEAIIGTLGPCGQNVFIDDPYTPRITNDGATIANSISFPDKFENLGAWIVKNTSSQTNDDVGDGTTTTAVLLNGIVDEALNSSENPMMIKVSLQEAVKEVVKKIKESSTPITKDDVYKIALISSENEEIAKIVSLVINNIGKDGVVKVEESKTFETYFEMQEGYKADVGFISPHFANDGKGAEAIYSDVLVLCCQKKISTLGDLKFFDLLKKEEVGQLVIVCEDIDQSILGVLIANKMQGFFSSLVVRANGSNLEDIAATVGATIISEGNGKNYNNLTLEDFGKAEKVICGQKETLFIAKKGAEQANRLKAIAETIDNQFEKKALIERAAKLTGGIAVIKIGALTDTDRGYKKDKTDDTVAAVKAALTEGIVEGGGMTLWRISEAMEAKTTGEKILKTALKAPLQTIIKNCGKEYQEVIDKMPAGEGYDARNDKYVKMIDNGIIDPAKVERVSLENAVSNASLFITAHCAITDAPIEK